MVTTVGSWVANAGVRGEGDDVARVKIARVGLQRVEARGRCLSEMGRAGGWWRETAGVGTVVSRDWSFVL